jgi:hypothetical protein
MQFIQVRGFQTQKDIFQKNGCDAYGLGDEYLNGTAIRQDYLRNNNRLDFKETVSKQYMAKQQHEPNANELVVVLSSVINWIKATFPKYRKEMKGIQWGFLYNDYKDKKV